nr:acyltransferase family protein [uncultured Porphyromonas sp.]
MPDDTYSSISIVLPQRGGRQSGFELLRIVAMIFILILHADCLSFGFPSTQEIAANPVSAFLRTWLETIAVVAVNTFVLISGYFGIRLRADRFMGLLFQSVFYIMGIYLVLVAIGWEVFSVAHFARCLSPLDPSGGWFIPVYIGLMLLSPILNTFVAQTGEKNLLGVIIALLLMQSVFGWGVDHLKVSAGYSLFSFILLYLIGQYIRLYPETFATKGKTSLYLGIYLGITLLNALIPYLASTLPLLFPSAPRNLGNNGTITALTLAYSSPLNIIGAVCLFITFSRLKIQSHSINWVASSVLAVYLIHCNEHLIHHFIAFVRQLSLYPTETFLVYLLGFLIVVFIGSILIDQVRKILWGAIFFPLLDKLRSLLALPF